MKSILKKIVLALGVDRIIRLYNRTPRILFWHGVDDIKSSKIEAESFDLITFTKQIDYLIKYYEVISINEFYFRYTNNKFTKREIVLTFDDGYANNLYVVAPILHKRNLPFTVFISTEHIDTGELFPTSIARLLVLASGLKQINVSSIRNEAFDISTEQLKIDTLRILTINLKERPLEEVRIIIEDLKRNLSTKEYKELVERYKSVNPMNWNEVRELKKLGATIGSHCKYHICCHENQDFQEVERQIIESKRIIENKLGDDCEYFAYPNGDFTDGSNKIVNEAGYKMGFSTKASVSIINEKQLASIPRIGVQRSYDTFRIHTNLNPLNKKTWKSRK